MSTNYNRQLNDDRFNEGEDFGKEVGKEIRTQEIIEFLMIDCGLPEAKMYADLIGAKFSSVGVLK